MFRAREKFKKLLIKDEILSLFLRAFLIAPLSGCGLFSFFEEPPQPQIKEPGHKESCLAGNAPFYVSQITRSQNDEPITVKEENGLKRTFSLNLRACLRDADRPDTPLQHAPFVVEYYNNVENKKERVTAISDSQGCIQWQETYKYKYTVRPLWLGLKRSIIKEKGIYAGEESIPMAVNPWLSQRDKEDGFPAILDVRCEYAGERHIVFEKDKEGESYYYANGLAYLEKTKPEEKPFVWAPLVSMQIRESNPRRKELETAPERKIERLLSRYRSSCGPEADQTCYKRQVRMVLFVPLQLRTLDRSGLTEEDLNGGTYDVETRLIISPEADKKNYLFHEKACENKGQALTESYKNLTLECDLSFSLFNQNAAYKLALRVKPSGNLPFRTFEGVYSGNLNFQNRREEWRIDSAYDSVYGQAIKDREDLKIIKSLEIKDIYAGENEEADGAPFEKPYLREGPVRGVNFYSLHLDGYGDYKLSHIAPSSPKCSQRENVVQRKAVFVGKICLKDVLNSQKLNNTPFRVFLERSKDAMIETGLPEKERHIEESGPGKVIEEIYFEESENKKRLFTTDGSGCISIPIALKHNLYDRQRYFIVDAHILSEALNLYGKVRLALSPWQRAFQAFQDAQNLHESVIRSVTNNVPKPKLIINQFRSINLFPSYGLDKLLNIHLFHRIYLLFQPFVMRPDNLALGLDYKARELLRDGHYLVRVLVLRNPQETRGSEDYARVQPVAQQNERRKNQILVDRISLEGADYITHTDSVVEAKANFINFYMPIYLSTQQFYYIASRNFLVIEIHPANPLKFKYASEFPSEDKDCLIDPEKTEWEPYSGHELQNAPYAGAFNIQNWFNWNLLQPVEGVDTDKIIERSEIGRKYKHFSFSPNRIESAGQRDEEAHRAQSPPPAEGCADGIYTDGDPQTASAQTALQIRLNNYDEKGGAVFKGADPPETGADRFSESSLPSCDLDPPPARMGPGIETYLRKAHRQAYPDILESFAKENSLKVVSLSDFKPEGLKFERDIKSAFKKYILREENAPVISLDEDFFSQFPAEDQALIQLKIKGVCGSTAYIALWTDEEKLKCGLDIVSAYAQSLKWFSEGKGALDLILEIIEKSAEAFEEELGFFKEAGAVCRGLEQKPEECGAYISKAMDYFLARSLPERHILGEALLSFLSPEEKSRFREELASVCNKGLIRYGRAYEECYYKELEAVSGEGQRLSSQEDMVLALARLTRSLRSQEWLNAFFRNKDTRNSQIFKGLIKEPGRRGLIRLIQKGIKKSDRFELDALSFTKPLCLFWFDSYLKDYLGEEQKISAYTNYIQKFDYHQVLNSELDFSHNEIAGFLPEFLKRLNSEEGEGLSGCYKGYANCLLADHCQERGFDGQKESLCLALEGLMASDASCPKILKEECLKNPSFGLCGKEDSGAFNSCNKRLGSFCLINGDADICAKYNSRCFQKEYLPCLTSKNPSIFSIDKAINYKDDFFPPLETCLKNPYEFFTFENKMAVYEISKKNPKYEGGFLRQFSVAANASIGSYMNWTAQRSRSLSVAGKAGAGPVLGNLFSRISSFIMVSLGIDFTMSQSASSNESNSERRAIDVRVAEGAFLTVGNANVTVEAVKYQKCLSIKPRPNAFMASFPDGAPELYADVWSKEAENTSFKKIIVSRPGLLLCAPPESKEEGEGEKITESYHYISQQMDAGNSQFLNLFDLSNRPFTLILRGRQEFVKFYYMLRLIMEGDNSNMAENGGINKAPENMFINYPFPVEEAIGLSLASREFNETGFHPGIYNYPDDSDEAMDAWFANLEKRAMILDPLTYNNIFDVPAVQKTAVPIQKSD